MQLLVDADWPGNVRELRNLIESMVVLAPGREIGPSDIPSEVREGGTRLLPMRVAESVRSVPGQELEFIFRSLMDLKLQIEDLKRRMDEEPHRVEVVDVGRRVPFDEYPVGEIVELDEEVPATRDDHLRVVYRPGMRMADVERAAIEAALAETRGNRRRAAERLGIGERTLYRKIKEYDLAERVP
jgi:DNA-binding NtrC family response regulator